MSQSYTASDIEVLSGLEPVRRRPGMYTHTQRPNHLAHEVVDNSVDEATSGYCSEIDVTLFKDGSLEVTDNGRGMPVDIHPQEKVSGVELILTPPARRRQVLGKSRLQVLRRPARRRRLGGQCASAAAWTAPSAAAARNTGSPSRTASCTAKLAVIGTVGPAQHRHDGALLAGPEVLRFRQILGAAAAAHAQGEGGPVPRPAHHLQQ